MTEPQPPSGPFDATGATPGPADRPVPPPIAPVGLPSVEWIPPVDGLPSYTPIDPPPARRRSPARLAAVAVGAVALLAGSAFAVYAMTRPDGNDSPEGAVHQMFSAIDQEDALGVVESLPPGERKVLHDPLVDSTKELQRLGVLKSFSLSNVPGADIKVRGLTTETTKLGDGVVLVNVTGGTISGVTIPKDVPIGDALRQTIEDNGGTVDVKADTFSEDLANDHLHLVTIKEGGGWHVSLAYSLAESIRSTITDEDGHHPAEPNFGGGPTPVGSDTPEGAVKGLVDAAVNLDAEQAITMTDPEEMRALYDYAPLFLPDIQQAVRDHKADGDAVKVDRLDTDVTGDGSIRRVTINGFDATIGSADDNTHIVYDGQCYDITSTYPGYTTYSSSDFGPGATGSLYGGSASSGGGGSSTGSRQTDHQHFCAGDDATSSDGSGSSDAALLGGLGAFGSASSTRFAVTVTQVDGRWYVSPVRTILDSMVEGLKGLQPSDVQKWGAGLDASSGSCCESGGSSSGPGGSTGTTIAGGSNGLVVPPVDPSTMPPEMLFNNVSPATGKQLMQACAPEVAAYLETWSPAQDARYFETMRDLYGCAAGIVPGYQVCLPLIDDAVTLAKSGAFTDAADSAAFTCLAKVTG